MNPFFNFCQIPYDASRREIKTAGKLAALLKVVDGRIRQGHDLPQFGASNSLLCGEHHRATWGILIFAHEKIQTDSHIYEKTAIPLVSELWRSKA